MGTNSSLGRLMVGIWLGTLITATSNASSLRAVEPIPNGIFDGCEDTDGNFYYAGPLVGTMDVDFGPGVQEVSASPESATADDPEAFVAKAGANGTLLWVRRFANIFSIDLTGDDEGNLYVLARFTHDMDADPGEGVQMLSGTSSLSVAIIKLDAAGQHLWHLHVGERAGGDVEILDAEVMANGNLCALGRFFHWMDMDPGPERITFYDDDGDRFVLQLSPEGGIAFLRQLKGYYREMRFDSDENLVLLGSSDEEIDLDSGPGELRIASYNAVVKMDAEANLIWGAALMPANWTYCLDILVDGNDDIYALGEFTEDCDFDPGADDAMIDVGIEQHIFLAKFSSLGELLWVRTAAPNGVESYPRGKYLGLASNGDVFAVGEFLGTSDFDDSARELQAQSIGREDAYIARFSPQGTPLGVVTLGGVDIDRTGRPILGRELLWLPIRYSSTFTMHLEDETLTYQSIAGSTVHLLTFDIDSLCVLPRTPETPNDTDLNGDLQVSLDELLRVIQLYNSPTFHCAASTTFSEDGYLVGDGTNRACDPYDADFAPQDWSISLDELLRVIQLYNSLGYHYCPDEATEDGFCPGPA